MSLIPQRELFEAITTHNPEAAKRALERGARWGRDVDGNPVHWQIGKARPEIWRYSAAMMALSKAMNTRRMSILELASQDTTLNWKTVVGAIVDPGDFANRIDRCGSRVMDFILHHWPAQLGRWQDTRDRHGGTLIHALARSDGFGQADQIRDLAIERGLDVNAVDTRGRTPLHVVHRQEVVRTLLECGADASLLDDKGQSAVQSCVARMKERSRKHPGSNSIYSEDAAMLWRLLDAHPILDHRRPGPLGRQLRQLLDQDDIAWKHAGGGARATVEQHVRTFEANSRKTALADVAKTQKKAATPHNKPKM